MMRMRVAGGIGALVIGAAFVLLIILLAVVLPRLGLGPGTLYSPAAGVPFIETSLLPVVIGIIYLCFAVFVVPLIFALYERLNAANATLMPLAAAAGVVASALFLGYAMIDLAGNPQVVSTYHQDAVLGGGLYVALRTAGNALNAGGLFAIGIAIGISGWVARGTTHLPAPLAYLLLVAGLTTTLSFIVLPLGLVSLLLAPIWSVWVGVALLRSP